MPGKSATGIRDATTNALVFCVEIKKEPDKKAVLFVEGGFICINMII